jgi:GNAT superfamily N-acetyltransferase
MSEIRMATAADEEAVREIWKSAGLESASEFEWQALLGNPRTSLILAEDAGRVIGAAIAAFDGWRAFVSHVAVIPVHRQMGVATDLLKAAEGNVRERGARRIYAIVDQTMTDGLALCTNNGYEPEGDVVLVKEFGA